MSRVLIIEDEAALLAGLRDAFEHNGHEVMTAPDGERGLAKAISGGADLIILDLMLPKMDGMQVCRELQQRSIMTPIIMLTARGEEKDRIAGLQLGADDYVTKPFSVRELLARSDAVLRRAGASSSLEERILVGEVTVDFKQYAVFRGEDRETLTDHEVRLMRLFLSHPHEVIARDRMLDEVWGYDNYPSTRTVDTFVYRLRQKIEQDPQEPRHLLTVHGVGYRFEP